MSYDPVVNVSTPGFAPYDEDELHPPAGFQDGHRNSFGTPSNMSFDSSAPIQAGAHYPYRDEPGGSRSSAYYDKEGTSNMGYPPTSSPPHRAYGNTAQKKRRWPWILGLITLLVLIIAAVVVPVYFKFIKKDSNSAAASSAENGGSGNSGGSSPTNSSGIIYGAATSGGYGSTITAEDGSTFQYMNTFGGVWVADPKDPYNNNAYAQSWSPPLNQSWDWGNDPIRG